MFYKLPNLRGGRIIGPNGLDLSESNREAHTYPVEGWTWFNSPLEAVAQIGWEPPEEMELDEYDPEDPFHLRIYSHPRFPADTALRHPNFSPPTEYDWGMMKLQKEVFFGVSDLGDIPLMEYHYNGEPVSRRVFQFSYNTDAKGAVELSVIETPGWCRNDGTWVDGVASEPEVYRGIRYNAWRDSARERIFEAYKTWLPLALEALGVVANIPEGEALSGTWLATHHAMEWQHYLSSGRKEAITFSLSPEEDDTAWLDSVIPDNTIPGLASGKTVREMILEGLR